MPEAPSRCPRCGGSFYCGMGDAQACACLALKLDAPTLAELQRRYTGCLCLACLRALAPAASDPSLPR